MAMIKCKECGKAVSDLASTCPSCGCPIGGGSVGGSAFEKRIEQYKSAGYILKKREGNTVVMKSVGWKGEMAKKKSVFIVIGVLTTLFGAWALLTFLFSNYLLGFFLLALTILFLFLFNMYEVNVRRVTISINTVGKIEETGCVLK